MNEREREVARGVFTGIVGAVGFFWLLIFGPVALFFIALFLIGLAGLAFDALAKMGIPRAVALLVELVVVCWFIKACNDHANRKKLLLPWRCIECGMEYAKAPELVQCTECGGKLRLA